MRRRASTTQAPLTLAALMLLLLAFATGGAEAKSRKPPAVAAQAPSDTLTRPARLRALYDASRFAAAESLAHAFLAADSARGLPETIETGRILDNLVLALYRQGQTGNPETLDLAKHAVALKEGLEGPNGAEYATSINILGIIHYQRGNYLAAYPLFKLSSDIRERVLGPGDVELAKTLNNLIVVLTRLGNFVDAKAECDRALHIFEGHPKPDSVNVAAVLTNRGLLERRLGDFGSARKSLEHALAIREKLGPPDSPAIAASLVNLGAVLNDTQEFVGARPLLERALELREKRLGPSNPELSATFNNLAEALEGSGDVLSARPLYVRSAANLEAAYGPQNPDLALAFGNLAGLDYRRGARDTAFAYAVRAEEVARENVRITAQGLSEQDALNYSKSRTTAQDLALSIARRQSSPDNLRRAWDTVIRGRALIFDETAERHRTVFAAGDSALLRLNETLASTRATLAGLVANPARINLENYRHQIEDSLREIQRLEEAVAARSAPFREALARNRQGFTDVERALPAGWALVAFVRYVDLGVPAPSAHQRRAATLDSIPRYLALVLSHAGADPVVVDIGPASMVDSLVALWRKSVTTIAADRLDRSAAERTCRARGRALRARVWDPLVPVLGRAAGVFLVPDGTLHTVNFGALPAGDSRYMVEEGPLMHCLSTERDLVRSPEERHGVGLLAFSGPDYDLAPTEAPPFTVASGSAGAGSTDAPVYRGSLPGCAGFSDRHFKDLPETVVEVRDIAAIWKQSHDAAGGALLDLSQRGASETALKRLGPGRQVIHLATHGFFLDPRCARSRPDGNAAQAEQASTLSENPLLLSGLALAGANLRGGVTEDADDGVLTAEEIASLDLSAADWIVLSACSSGLGTIQSGEGVFGLRRAFAIAGAHSLIMSLWPVEDLATRQWITALYRARFVRHESTSEAWRDACRAVLSMRRSQRLSTHPSTWGAFVAVGDWR